MKGELSNIIKSAIKSISIIYLLLSFCFFILANVLHFIHDNNWKKNRNNLFPVLYKKTINLGELHIPVYTILFVIAVVLILYELTKRLHPVSSTDKGMIFGLQLEGETRKSIQDEWDKECSFIELNEVNVADAVTIKKNEPIFYTYKTFNCFHDISYMEYLESDLSIKTKLGAIELLNPNNFHVWINERVYHTAALMVNMAENLILRYEGHFSNTSSVIPLLAFNSLLLLCFSIA